MKDIGSVGEFEQLVLLALLRLGDGAYGASIRREIEERTGRELAISAVYVALSRLERKGMIESEVGEPTPTRGGRRRKLITLRPAGRRALAHALRQIERMTDGIDSIEQELEA